MIPFIQAHHFVRGRQGSSVLWVVVHTMESPEGPATAENVAAWFHRSPAQGGPPEPASAHYCVDVDSVVQCVRESDQAAGARGANRKGIHVELAGRASQTSEQWRDVASMGTLRTAAALVADICGRNLIDVGLRVAAELREGKRGITGHACCSEAFNPGGHWDPGPHFPWHQFLEMVRAAG